MLLLAGCAALVAGAGSAVALGGWLAVRRLPAEARAPDAGWPGITVLKPLFGDEPMLETALASVCAQDYPRFQVVFGVQNPADPALDVVARVRARFPACDIAVVVDDTATGSNRKVANLLNMRAAARHEVLVIADSDIHAGPDYLRRLAAGLAVPGVGLVTTLYSGLPANRSAAAALAATGVTHGFLPGAALARLLGRRDSLGATMALRAATLNAVGGFAALLNHLADDHMLGRLVRGAGLEIGLAATVPATTVPETSIAAVFRHELRWARTIRALAPVAFAGSCVQYPLAWALLALLLSGGAGWASAVVLAAWAARAAAAYGINRAVARRQAAKPPPVPLWLLPLRDLISTAVLLASFAGDRVEWRGQVLRAAGVDGFALPGKAPAT